MSYHISNNQGMVQDIKTKNGLLPLYIINLDKMIERKIAMKNHLDTIGYTNYQFVSALTAKTCNLIMVESPCQRV
eukprot:gene14995-20172_t